MSIKYSILLQNLFAQNQEGDNFDAKDIYRKNIEQCQLTQRKIREHQMKQMEIYLDELKQKGVDDNDGLFDAQLSFYAKKSDLNNFISKTTQQNSKKPKKIDFHELKNVEDENGQFEANYIKFSDNPENCICFQTEAPIQSQMLQQKSQNVKPVFNNKLQNLIIRNEQNILSQNVQKEPQKFIDNFGGKKKEKKEQNDQKIIKTINQ